MLYALFESTFFRNYHKMYKIGMSKQKIMLKSLDKEKIFELGEKRESNYLVRDLVVILAKLILQEKVRKNRLVPKKAFFFRP